MKRIAALSVLISMFAGATLAQAPTFDEADAEASRIGELSETPVYLTTSGRDNPTSVALSEAIRKAFENSRPLGLVYVNPDVVMHVVAPTTLTLTEGAKGQIVTMNYDISSPRGSTTSYKATCAVKNLDDCARTVLMRAERFVRDSLLP